MLAVEYGEPASRSCCLSIRGDGLSAALGGVLAASAACDSAAQVLKLCGCGRGWRGKRIKTKTKTKGSGITRSI